MKLIESVAGMQAEADDARRQGRRLVLVPTMGSLHEGHLALVRRAREAGDHVSVSIFVNPTQFAPGEDFDRYPRDLSGDMALLDSMGGVDAIYAPPPSALYPNGRSGVVWVVADRMAEHLCGPFRPGHFRGVTTIVAKLFNAARPHAAVFGLKDAQQFFILQRMVAELDFGIEMIGLRTVREADGLAMSSRNRYLEGNSRLQAVALSKAVFAARTVIEEGVRRGDEVTARMLAEFRSFPDVRVQYAQVVDSDLLQPAQELIPGKTVVAAVAAHVGGARLIDNQIIPVPVQ